MTTPTYEISYGFSDGQGPFLEEIPSVDIQQALYRFTRKHPNVDPVNINHIKRVVAPAVVDCRSSQKPSSTIFCIEDPNLGVTVTLGSRNVDVNTGDTP